jgi:hypothetical protein
VGYELGDGHSPTIRTGGAISGKWRLKYTFWKRTVAPPNKRVIYLFQSGAPSQMALFGYKPELKNLRGKELADSIRKRQRLTGMTATQTSFPIAPSRFRFVRHGQSGAWISEMSIMPISSPSMHSELP